uniref:Hephaestin like 1 n=1 Tax=Crocodylus porosus TaxID=8502 RepID=A0A7M4FAK8_CROPO
MTIKYLQKPISTSFYVKRGPIRIGRIYKKAIYRQFTDGTYTQEIPKASWLGFLGPVLKAEEEDIFIVHLKNFGSRPYSMHPHGVFYDKESEGALYPDGTGGKSKEDDFVVPGRNYTYTWRVKNNYAPTSADPACLTWIYHSHIDTPRDISTGLIGPLLICKKGTLDDSTMQRTDASKTFALMFSAVDENLSWYLDENINTFCLEPTMVDKEDEGFIHSNKMHAINGYIFGNLPILEMCAGESVSWHLFGMGNEIDMHSTYFFGHTVTSRGHRSDVIHLFPATFITAEMIAGNVGKWLLACQVNDHLQAGMEGLYNVQTCNKNISQPSLSGRERRYFIAAEEVLWDYGPEGYDKFTGQGLNATGSNSATFFTRGEDRIGGKYWKVHYVEYADAAFTRRKNLTEVTKHLGILGPVIKAEVGDTVLVTFANKADKNYSIMAHGVSYNKLSEGVAYLDGKFLADRSSPAHVKPGETFTYEWRVPETIGPTASDPPCLTYLYYSGTDSVRDTSSGLVGPLLVCRKNTLNHDGTQKGIDREFYLLFTIFDENVSWYLDRNIEVFTGDSSKVNKEDEDFQESNKMHGTFEVVCRTFDHFVAGMKQLYEVNSCTNTGHSRQRYATMRTFYIAAEEVEWDYASNKTFQVSQNLSSALWKVKGEDRIGSKYKKVVYREYTNGDFTRHKVRSAREEHLEILGPLIHAEVGETILIVFKNKASRPYSITAHGIEEVGSGERPETPVTLPGEINTYRWNVPEWSGPGYSDPNCITWVYYSTVNFVKDMYSGLVGPLIICRKGILKEKGLRKDIDREFALLFLVFDENESWYLKENIEKYLHKNPDNLNYTEEFLESNVMHAINGKIYNNLLGLTMNKGENTNWYLIGMGNEIDIHTVHFHAQSFIFKVGEKSNI